MAGPGDSSQGGSSVASTIQGKNSTPSSSLKILVLQLPLNPRFPPRQLHSDGQESLQPPHMVHEVVAHHDPEKPLRLTQRAMLHPAQHLAWL